MKQPKSVTLSKHQKEVVAKMRNGALLVDVCYYKTCVATIAALMSKGIVDLELQLTELGKTIAL